MRSLDILEDDDDQDQDRSPTYVISGRDDVTNWAKTAVGATSDRTFLSRVAAVKPVPACIPTVGNDGAKMIKRIALIAQGLYKAMGRLEAQYMRRPNTLCSLYTPTLAPGATTSFQVQPGVGNSFYRLMGLIADDTQCSIMGFTSLKVGGQEHVNFSQSSPAAPVANAVPWAIFQLKESSFQANLAPWVGQVFDANTPVLGTVVNMTVAASGDAITVAARIVWLTQTDPCGFRYPQALQQSQQTFNRIRRYSQSLFLGKIGEVMGDGGIH